MAVENRSRAVSWIDAVAATVALIALAGVIWSPKLSNSVARATGSIKSVQVSVDVRGLPTADKAKLISDALAHGTTSLVIRNQPAGSLTLVEIQDISSKLNALLPDGTVIEVPDPNRELQGILEARFVLEGEATVSDSGIVMAGTKLKIGSPVELEGPRYRINGSVSGLEMES
ncbi:MAG: DUF4330 domain-containing protein [Synechococcus sp. MED-G135]|jgi:hypothetical protein|nr:MAG: DUF4330 domain-containing protein [Synechococcus sp. MED-G135]